MKFAIPSTHWHRFLNAILIINTCSRISGGTCFYLAVTKNCKIETCLKWKRITWPFRSHYNSHHRYVMKTCVKRPVLTYSSSFNKKLKSSSLVHYERNSYFFNNLKTWFSLKYPILFWDLREWPSYPGNKDRIPPHPNVICLRN